MNIGDGKQLGLVFHKELIIKNPTDVSIESEALGGAVETVRTVSFIAAETGRTARL